MAKSTGGQGVVLGYVKYVLGFDSLAFEQGIGDAEKRMKAAQKSLGKTADKFGDMGVKLSAALTAPLIGFAAKGISEARETQDALAQVNAAISSMGNAAGRSTDQLTALADKLELSSLYEGDQILRKVTANLLTFGNIAGETFDRAQQSAVDLATRMGTDLQSAALLVGKALNDPIKGMSALGRAGIQFTEAQKAQIKALNESGQAAKAQAIILGELERQFGGAAAAAQNVDPINKATDAFNQMAEKVGTALLPLIPPLTDALVSVLESFTSLSPETQKWVLVIGAAVAAIGPLLLGIAGIVSGFSALLPVLTAIGPAFLVIRTALVALTPLIWGAVKALAAMALTPVGAVITAIAVAVGAVYLAWKNWDKIQPILAALYKGVKTWLMDKLSAVWDWLTGKIETVRKAFYNLYDAVVGHSYIPDMVDEIGQNIARLQGNMVAPIQGMTTKAAEAFKQLQTDVGGIMARLFPTETAIQGLQAELVKLDEALAAKLISPEVWGKARERLNRELQAMKAKAAEEGAADVGIWSSEEAQREMETWTGTMGEILPTVKAANDNFANSFKDMSERVLGSMRNLVDGIKNGDFLDILGGVLDVFLSLGSTGLFGKGLQTSIGKTDFGGFRANGGPVGAGRSYIVGERGPEWFTPGRSGYVTPNAKGGGRQAPVVIQMYSEEGPALVPRVTSLSEGVTMQNMTRSAAYSARAGRQRLVR